MTIPVKLIRKLNTRKLKPELNAFLNEEHERIDKLDMCLSDLNTDIKKVLKDPPEKVNHIIEEFKVEVEEYIVEDFDKRIGKLEKELDEVNEKLKVNYSNNAHSQQAGLEFLQRWGWGG